MLLGALPGLLAETYLLATFNTKRWNHVVLVMIGITLICSSVLTFIYRKAGRFKPHRNGYWLPWFTFPIGIETGFSSAGAGALGTILLFNYSDMPPSRVVGTDLLFGIALAAGGTLFHFSLGSISTSSLKEPPDRRNTRGPVGLHLGATRAGNPTETCHYRPHLRIGLTAGLAWCARVALVAWPSMRLKQNAVEPQRKCPLPITIEMSP
jgi:hypothetical protein